MPETVKAGRGSLKTDLLLVHSAFRREKTAGDASSGFNKMERAKRLELGNQSPDTPAQPEVAESVPPADTQLSTQGGLDLAEIVSAWPRLHPEIRTAVLTLIRVAAAEKRT